MGRGMGGMSCTFSRRDLRRRRRRLVTSNITIFVIFCWKRTKIGTCNDFSLFGYCSGQVELSFPSRLSTLEYHVSIVILWFLVFCERGIFSHFIVSNLFNHFITLTFSTYAF